MKKLHSATPWAQAEAEAATERERAAPARPAGIIADVLVPLLQSAISGALLAALLVFVLSELVPDWDADLLKVWAITALAITAVAWLLLLGQTRRLLWALERVTKLDIDQNGTIGQPRDRLVFVDRERAKEETTQAHERGEWLTFVSFIKQLPVRGTTITEWEGALGRDRYYEYRDCLIDYGFAKWRSYSKDGNPNVRQGWELTATVDDILDRISVD
jgi:hypothetical protein